MMIKLDIYRKFTNALAVTVVVSVGWICYEVTYHSLSPIKLKLYIWYTLSFHRTLVLPINVKLSNKAP